MKRFATFAAMALALGTSAFAADSYKADPVHSTVTFRAKHVGTSFYYGRFNDPSGVFTLDESDVTKSTFNFSITVDKVDTHNDKRDAHLKSPDFFNEKQYPTITFKSTAVKKGEGAKLEVTGDLTLHGVTKSVTVPIELTGKGEFPKGVQRAGLEAVFEVKMSDYEIKGLPGAIDDSVRLIVSIEGTKE